MPTRLVASALFFAALTGSGAGHSQPGGTSNETLTLSRAIVLAMESNRDLKSARLETAKAEDRLAAARTRRYPALKWSALGMQRVTALEFFFPAGTFGTINGIPVPEADTTMREPLRPGALLIGSVVQPLSQQYKIGLTLGVLSRDRDLAAEQERAKRQDVIAQVKRTYYSILQTQSALESVEQSIQLYRELDRLTGNYVLQQVALKAENLDAKTRLANAEYEALTLRNPLETQKEQLNSLLGRDISTPFKAVELERASWAETDLDGARRQALDRRPEVRQAELRLKRAETDRRAKKAEYIPDLGLSFSYFSPVNYGNLIPANITTIGVQLDWEPFDWGRKHRELSEKDKIIEQAGLELREVRTQVTIDAGSKFRKLREARQKMVIAQLARDTARERLRVGTNRYKEQTILFKDVLELQTSLAEADHQCQSALLDYWTAKADFEKAIGEEE